MRFVGLDPSTTTGFVALSESGDLIENKVLTGISKSDPVRMITMIDEVAAHVQQSDFVVIENFGFASKRGVHLGGIGWGIRMMLTRRGIPYYEVAPGQLKKYITGNGHAKKPEFIPFLNDLYGYYHDSDDVRDAYVLAQIGRSMVNKRVVNDKQREVIQKIFQTINEKAEK